MRCIHIIRYVYFGSSPLLCLCICHSLVLPISVRIHANMYIRAYTHTLLLHIHIDGWIKAMEKPEDAVSKLHVDRTVGFYVFLFLLSYVIAAGTCVCMCYKSSVYVHMNTHIWCTFTNLFMICIYTYIHFSQMDHHQIAGKHTPIYMCVYVDVYIMYIYVCVSVVAYYLAICICICVYQYIYGALEDFNMYVYIFRYMYTYYIYCMNICRCRRDVKVSNVKKI